MKRVMAVLSVAGFLAVALFATNTFAAADVAGVPEVSVDSTTSEATPVVEEQETAGTGIEATAAEYETVAGRWGATRIDAPSAWAVAGALSPTTVAILDTGIASDAPFAHRVVGAMDFTGEGMEDEHGHGTHMAGTVAAIAPNASLFNVKVADSRGRCETAAVASGIRWAANQGAHVINVSLEVAPSAELEKAVSYAWERGAIVIVAAGNSGSNSPAYPAAYVDALAVAGTNQSDGLAVLSNHGDWIDVAAPGYKIYAELPGGQFGYETGTSPAAAHVSGVAALLSGIATDVSGNGAVNDEIRTAIENSCEALGASGTGNGLVNAFSAVQSLAV